MNYNTPQHVRTAQRIQSFVGFLFCIFFFSYLWKVQGGMLAVAQHILAKGQTVYYPFIGALVITIGLMSIQWALNHLTRLWGEWYALSFFPSSLMLAWLTSADASLYSEEALDYWTWLLPVSLGGYIGLVWFARHVHFSLSHVSSAWEVKLLLTNMAILTSSVLFVCFFGVTRKVTHDMSDIQQALSRNDFLRALQTGDYHSQTNKPVTALRAFAMARAGEMGDRLFAFPQPYGAEGLWIERADSVRMLYAPDSIYWYLGAYPSAQTPKALKFLRYLNWSERQRKPMAKDYLLSALLLEKRLPEFVRELSKSQAISDSIGYPLHYQEALVLYRHRVSASLPYRHAEQEARFEAYQQAVRKGNSMDESAAMAGEDFKNTYWWYYDFATKKNE